MIDLETTRELLLAFPEVEEWDHFGKLSYRVKGKIFATLDLDTKKAVLKLTATQQPEYCENQAIYPANGRWGILGWTSVHLDAIAPLLFKEAATMAWGNVTPKKLVKQLKSSKDIV